MPFVAVYASFVVHGSRLRECWHILQVAKPYPVGIQVIMKKCSYGFTLIELIVVVAIAGILGTLAAPSFRNLINSNRLTSAANELLGATMNARSEAIKRSARVVLCKSGDAATCNNGLTWDSGWIAFVDDNNNGTRDGGEELLRVGQGSEKVTATADTAVANYISFTSRGAIVQTGGAAQNGVITLCISGQPSRQLTLVSTGRASLDQGVICP